jgi:hypothetical protein
MWSTTSRSSTTNQALSRTHDSNRPRQRPDTVLTSTSSPRSGRSDRAVTAGSAARVVAENEITPKRDGAQGATYVTPATPAQPGSTTRISADLLAERPAATST